MKLILTVLFVMVMFLWVLVLLGAVSTGASPWLAWFAILFVGIAVFVPPRT